MLSQKEIEAILIETLENRVKYSIKRIADREELWVIGDKDGLRILRMKRVILSSQYGRLKNLHNYAVQKSIRVMFLN